MIPSFDLRDYSHDKPGFAAALGQAFHDFGFVRLSGHGIPPGALSAAEVAAAEFFARPEAAKDAHVARGKEGLIGYTRNAETARGAAAADLKEEWSVRLRMPGGRAAMREAQSILEVPAVPDFSPAVKTLFREFEKATGRLMKPLSLYMGLGENGFKGKFNRSHSMMRLLHYPEGGSAASHLDLNFLTWLVASKPGLYVTDRKGQEHAVKAQGNELILNGGMQLGVTTNNDLQPSWHRVEAKEPRDTIVFFAHPNPDYVLEPLPKFLPTPPTPRPDYFPPAGQGITVENFVKQEVDRLFRAKAPRMG